MGGNMEKAEMSETIAERLRKLRVEKGITQAGAALSMNISRECLSRLESGERIPATDVVMVMAKYYDVSADYILFGNRNTGCSDEDIDYIRLKLKNLQRNGKR